jgi:hypothetical protein
MKAYGGTGCVDPRILDFGITWGSGIYVSGDKRPEHLRPASAEIKNAWSHNSASPYVLLVRRLINYKGDFTYYLHVP